MQTFSVYLKTKPITTAFVRAITHRHIPISPVTSKIIFWGFE